MRRSPANSTNRSLAAFGKLQHIHRPHEFFDHTTGRRSASHRIVTIGSSVNRVFFMAPPCPEDAILSSVSWSENHPAGQGRFYSRLSGS